MIHAHTNISSAPFIHTQNRSTIPRGIHACMHTYVHLRLYQNTHTDHPTSQHARGPTPNTSHTSKKSYHPFSFFPRLPSPSAILSPHRPQAPSLPCAPCALLGPSPQGYVSRSPVSSPHPHPHPHPHRPRSSALASSLSPARSRCRAGSFSLTIHLGGVTPPSTPREDSAAHFPSNHCSSRPPPHRPPPPPPPTRHRPPHSHPRQSLPECHVVGVQQGDTWWGGSLAHTAFVFPQLAQNKKKIETE
jgi:hypothetical protein